MADAMISVVVARVAAIIEDQIRYQVNLVRGVEKEVLDLSEKLNTIKNVLDDAEKRGVKDQSVKNWLKKLEDTTYEMDDILDEWNYTLLKHKMMAENDASPKQKVSCSFAPSSCLSFNRVAVRRRTANKIQNVKARLDQILKEKDEFNFVMSLPSSDNTPKSGRVQSTSSIDLEKVRGVDIERNKNDIVMKLMRVDEDRDTQIVSIVGMGGIGKTTLAQLVYNHTLIKDCFELKIWICVSDPFDVAGIARGIVESVEKETIPPNTNQLELVLQKLRDSVAGKKFLLVLDDVWTEDYYKWEPLKINLQYGAPTSKILVTTRNERVAKMMGTLDKEIYRPQQLSDEECWLVMRRISLSGRSEEECREFEDVGKKIASKCKGLPLAANVLGSLLQFKNSWEEWENVWKSEIWQLEKAEVELFPHLLLSYNELPPSLKRCFSYYAVYPKDYEIEADSLMEEWMALGYLGPVTGNGGVEFKGQDYFNNLAMRSLFQIKNKIGAWNEKIVYCNMHDIIHDFAQFLRKNNVRAEMRKRSCQDCDPLLVSQVQVYHSIYWDKKTPPHLCDCVKSVRVLRFGLKLGGFPKGMKKLIHLRWLCLSYLPLSKEDLKIICSLYLLQTLLLDSCKLEEIPVEIGNLVHLRHLNLVGNEKLKELAESMCSLLELRILDIRYCSDHLSIPEWIYKLKNLQHLLIDHLTRLPQGVGELSNLLTLNMFRGRSCFRNLRMLKKLNQLSGSLKLEIHFSSMSDVEELVEEAQEAELRNKIHIQQLYIVFKDEMDERERSSSTTTTSSLWIKVIEALEPNMQKVNLLKIKGYKGSRLPHWMSSPLNLIKEIRLDNMSEVCSLPAMGKLPFLEVLHLNRMMELKVVGREFLGIDQSSSSINDDVVVAFPKLKQLTFRLCCKWEEWEDITTEEEESAAISVMPSLTELKINGCSLKMLPHRLLLKAPSLQILNIEDSWELELRYEGLLQLLLK